MGENRTADPETIQSIRDTTKGLNELVASLPVINTLENAINTKFADYGNGNVIVSLQSEISVKGLYSDIVPYIKESDDDNLYPAAGEGRKKLLSYSIFNILSQEQSIRKVNLFLIEEPENNLHKSVQIALSQILFNESGYDYLFVATHSPYILYEMDDVNLIRIFNEGRINSASVCYKVPDEFQNNKTILNRQLSEAIFANKVLLVEGPSEQILFDKVISHKKAAYEAEGTYILAVNGIGFDKYYSILKNLHIKTIIKTDNDLRKSGDEYSVLGFTRCNKYIDDQLKKLPTDSISDNSIASKRSLYDTNKTQIDRIRSEFLVFLSKVDLENDLDEVLHDRLVECLNTTSPVDYLQKKKLHNMAELILKLDGEDCNKIYDHYNFKCLKEV